MRVQQRDHRGRRAACRQAEEIANAERLRPILRRYVARDHCVVDDDLTVDRGPREGQSEQRHAGRDGCKTKSHRLQHGQAHKDTRQAETIDEPSDR